MKVLPTHYTEEFFIGEEFRSQNSEDTIIMCITEIIFALEISYEVNCLNSW